jgi:hypothetical protein
MQYTLQDSGFKGYMEDDSIHIARVLEIKREKSGFTDDKTGEEKYRLEWKFQIWDDTDDFDNEFIWGRTGETFTNHPNCKLFSWSQSLIGQPLTEGYPLDTDELLEQLLCRVVVKQEHWKDKKDGTDKTRHFVADVLPMPDAGQHGQLPQRGCGGCRRRGRRRTVLNLGAQPDHLGRHARACRPLIIGDTMRDIDEIITFINTRSTLSPVEKSLLVSRVEVWPSQSELDAARERVYGGMIPILAP